ncbi:MAG: hypothetical protein Q9174_006379, partial [Haloplaca sp. 1 TL-2023]
MDDRQEPPAKDILESHKQSSAQSNGARVNGAAATGKSIKKPKQNAPGEPPVPTIAVFYGFLLVNTLAAAFAPIQDCDEVFNYWEPTHYLNRGFGLQTWEYSPEYSIRSWLYIVIHAIIGKFGSLLSSRPTAEFYFIRMALGAVCAACETRLFSTICRTFNVRVGIMFGMSAFMDWRGGLKTAPGMMWFGIGAIVGWPFSGLLLLPLLAEDLVLSSFTGDISEIIYRLLDGAVRSTLAV